MRTQTAAAVVQARETSRHAATGEFGTQPHADSGIVAAPTMLAGDRACRVFDDEDGNIGLTAYRANSSENPYKLREWDGGDLIDQSVSNDAIDLAFHACRDETTAQIKAYSPIDPWATLQAADHRFAKVAAEAARVQRAWDAIVGQARQTGPTEVTGAKHDGQWRDAAQVAKDIRGDLKSAHDAGLLPPGTSCSVKSRKFAGGQSVNVVLQGLPDTAIYEPMSLLNGRGFGRPTPYAKALTHVLETITDAYNRQDVDSMTDYFNVAYYSHATIEDERTATWRAEDAAQRKATKS